MILEELESHFKTLSTSNTLPSNLSSSGKLLSKLKSNEFLKELSENNENTEKFFDITLKLMKHPNVSIELAIVCGNSFVKLGTQYKGKEDEFKSWILSWILRLTEEQINDLFSQICLTTGCLNYGPNNEDLMEKYFQIVLRSCQVQSNHAYQSFQTLKLWSLKALQYENRNLLNSNQPGKLQSLLELINANWENPLRGVSDLLIDTMGNILDLLDDHHLNSQLLEKTLLDLNWKLKSIYPPLVVLMPRIGVKKVLENYPDFGKNLSQSLTTNHLASAGACVYRIIVKTKHIFPTWKKQLLRPLMYSLSHDERSLVRSNAKNNWLNPTLAHLPEEAAKNMFECLCQCVECEMIKFLILKGQRLNGQIDCLNEDQMHLIVQGLNHSNPDVCQAAFAVICHVKKKALRPSLQELKASIDFIIDHLTVDDPSFRQCLLSNFTQLMIRCRDTSLNLIKKKEFERQDMLQMN